MKIKILFIALLILSIFSQNSYSQETDTISIDKLFKENFTIGQDGILDKFSVFLKNTIDIYKIKPESIEIAYISFLLKDVVDYEKSFDILMPNFLELYNKYYQSKNNYDIDTSQKLILSYMLLRGFNSNNSTDESIMLAASKEGENFLKAIKEQCTNKSYSAIATLMLSYIFIKSEFETEFITKFPNHPAIPFVEALAISRKYSNNNHKLIDELLQLKDKHPNVLSPFGYKLYIQYYGLIVNAYFELGELDKAKEYLNIIKSEAPDYWNLPSLEKLLSNIQKGQSSFDF